MLRSRKEESGRSAESGKLLRRFGDDHTRDLKSGMQV